MTVVELVVAMTVLLVGVLGFSKFMVSTTRSTQKSIEVARASQAVRERIEQIEAYAFSDCFRAFNADPADDPGGAGSAPGAVFSVPGLDPLPDDADGITGEIVFPTAAGAPAVLREDLVDAALGMPNDLDRDGVVDAGDHATDYARLPVLVRVRWRSASGPAVFELKTLLANY